MKICIYLNQAVQNKKNMHAVLEVLHVVLINLQGYRDAYMGVV